MTKQKILIAGSGGFIGSNLIRHILKSSTNYTVVGIDRCDHPNVLNTIYSNKGAEFHIADATDKHIIKTIFDLEKPDIVIQAINSQTPINNVTATENLLENSYKYNARFVLLSSYEIYDRIQNAREDSITGHISPANEKIFFQRGMEILVEKFGIHFNILRLSNNIGPRQYNGIVPESIRLLMQNKPGILNYNGSHIRSYIHVQDTCNAILNILDSWKNNEIYNISTKQELSYIEVLQEICNAMNAPHDLVKLNSGVIDLSSLTADNSKIKSIGWTNSWKFKDSISQCCTWYKNNSWFLKG